MSHSAQARVVVLAALLCSTAGVGIAQAQQQTKIEKTPIRSTPANSGEEMFKSYCTPCHGLSGKGDGPAAAALKNPPANLTLLAKNNNGKFPDMHVAAVLKGGAGTPAHGSAEMPVWGPLFSQVSSSKPGIVALRISNLSKYIETLQAN